MLIEHDGKRPRVHDSAYVAPTAVLCGDVRVGADCRILFGAVLTAETGTIEVGESCIVMENALLRGRESHPGTIGDHVLVGPHAHVNGARIGSQVFLATGVSVFPGAQIGSASEVRINAVVHVNSRVEPDTTVPIGWIAVGDPARLFEPGAHEQLWEVQEAIGLSRHRLRTRARRGEHGPDLRPLRREVRPSPRRPSGGRIAAHRCSAPREALACAYERSEPS